MSLKMTGESQHDDPGGILSTETKFGTVSHSNTGVVHYTSSNATNIHDNRADHRWLVSEITALMNQDQLTLTNPARRTAARRTCDKFATELS